MMYRILLTFLALMLSSSIYSIHVKNYSVCVSVEIDEITPSLIFTWPVDVDAEFYYIFRKAKNDTIWRDTLAILPGNTTEFIDYNVEIGKTYEYGFYKTLTVENDTFYVECGKILEFNITDSWGDGLCCHHGLGSYTIKGKDKVYLTGGKFGAEEIKNFTVDCEEGNMDEIVVSIKKDVFPLETIWQVTDIETSNVIANGGPYLPHRYSHICAGIKISEIENMGTVLLVIDDSFGSELDFELNRYQQDLLGEGWKVKSILVNRDDDVTEIKEMILEAYQEDQTINTLFLIGHVPVPYSGNLVSGHPDHTGAYPADVYYAELDDEWTDDFVNNTTALREANHNVPGDGKFDRTFLESDVDLQLGRVDLYDLDVFPVYEVELLRNYFNKNHDFRTGNFDIERRALVDDNVGELGGMAPAANGWRNFSGMFGSEKISEEDYYPTLAESSYLWSYGCGGGSYISCQGIGTSTNFAMNGLQSVFNMLYGSYFGDWDNYNNILRAPLAATGYSLTNVWAGAPNWHFHHMALGETIGYSTKVTQNNKSLYGPTDKARQVHAALMGDPTLKMFIVKPARNLSIYKSNNEVQLSWEASFDNVLGYNVYRSSSINGDFIKINSEPVETLSFTDSNPFEENNVYIVRALKLETSSSGSFYNLSSGIIDSTLSGETGLNMILPENQFNIYPNPFSDELNLELGSDTKSSITITVYSVDLEVVAKYHFDENIGRQIYELGKYNAVANLKEGVYFLQIKEENKISTLKLVKISS